MLLPQLLGYFAAFQICMIFGVLFIVFAMLFSFVRVVVMIILFIVIAVIVVIPIATMPPTDEKLQFFFQGW